MVFGLSIPPSSESNVTLNVTLADSAWSHARMDSPGRSYPVEMRQGHQMVQGCGHEMYRLRRSRFAESPRRPWRARCPPGRLSRSPGGCESGSIVRGRRNRREPRTESLRSEWGRSEAPARCRGSLIRFGCGEAQAVVAATSSGKTRHSTSETP